MIRDKLHELMWKIVFFFFLILLSLMGVYFVLFRTELFVIKNISCKTQFGSCEEADEELLEKFKDERFFGLDTQRVEEKLLGHFKNRRVSVYKVIPSSLEIFIDKRAGRVGLKNGWPGASEEGYWLTDLEGTVLAKSETSALPLMYVGDLRLDLGENLEPKNVRALRLLYKTYQVVSTDWGVLGEDLLTVSLEEGVIVKYSLGKDVDTSIGSLQLVLSEARMNDKIPKEIDLRFRNAVLRY